MDPQASPTPQPTTPTTPEIPTPETAIAPPAPKKGFFASIMSMLGFGKSDPKPENPAPPVTPPMQSVDTSTPADPPKTL